MVQIIILAWKNTIARPLSMLLTLVLFALGVGLTALILLLNAQMTDKFEKNLAGIDVVLGAKGSPLQLILANMYHIDAPTGNVSLDAAKPFLNPRHPLIKQGIPLSLGDSYKGFRIVGSLHDFVGLYKGQIAQGQLWSANMEATIGATVATQTGLKLGDTFASNHGLDEEAEAHDGAFKVVGIFQPSGTVLDQLILTNNQSFWQVHAHEAAEHVAHTTTTAPLFESDRAALLAADSGQQITSVLIQFKEKRNIQALNFQRNINQNTDFQAATPAIEINRLFELLGFGEQSLKALAGVIIVVSSLSIFISLFNSLRERRYELALMRVMGASKTRLFGLILTEGLILSALGCILGLLLSHGAMGLLAQYMGQTYRYAFTGKIWLEAETYLVAIALAIGIVAALIPAFNAYKTQISSTLTKK